MTRDLRKLPLIPRERQFIQRIVAKMRAQAYGHNHDAAVLRAAQLPEDAAAVDAIALTLHKAANTLALVL